MADTTVDHDSIGPRLDLEDITFPPAVGERMATVYGVDAPIETGAEWVEATRGALSEHTGRTPTPDDLCTRPDGAHTFEDDGGSQSYVCVLDPLVYPFLADTPGTVRSETPVYGETVEFTVESDGVTVSHADAVISLGVTETFDGNGQLTPDVVYGAICEYIHVFADETEYERWAENVDGVTTVIPVPEGIGVARELATALFE